MAKKSTNELTAGIFVVAALAAGVAVVIWLGGASLFRSINEVAFYVPQDSGSMGLAVGSFIRVNDADIGQLTEIRYDPGSQRTLYIGQVDPAVRLYSDGRARVESGFIGTPSVVILDAGSAEKPQVSAANPLELSSGGLTASLNNISAELDPARREALLAKLHEIINRIKDATGTVARIADQVALESNRDQIDSLLAKLHRSMDDLNAMTSDARPKVKDTLTAVQETAESIREYSKKDLAEIFEQVRDATTDIGKIAADFAVVSDQAKEIILVNRERVDEIIDNMSQTSASLKSASKEIRRNPWRLLYRPKPGEFESQNIYDAARSFASGAEQLDQALMKLSGLSKAHPEGLPAGDPQVKAIREHLAESFDRFRRVEDALWEEMVGS